MNSWMEVHQQWQEGVFYPRWAALAHSGYGEARFLFYPPASWMLGSFLGLFLPWKMVPGAYIWIVLSLSGLSMFCLARCWLEWRDAVFAAALYAVNPYHLVIVYWRSALAELLAGVLLPLLLLWILRLEERRWRAVIPLGLVVAVAWLTNAPSAVMVNYSLGLLVVVLAVRQKSARPILFGVAAAAIGIALAAFYVLPAAYEEKWVNISQVLSPGVQPADNFLFTTLNDADHNHFNRLVSLVAVAEMVWLALAIGFSNKRTRTPTLWTAMTAWGAATALVMFSFTSLLWNHLPQLKFVQLPWRWLLCLNVSLVLLFVIACQRWWMRLLGYTALLAVLVFVSHRVQPPWWDHASDVELMHRAMLSGDGYEGTDEYVPINADSYEIDKSARKATLDGPGRAPIRIEKWDAEDKKFSADVTEPTQLVLRLFNYPAWQVQVNGHSVSTRTHENTGQMIVPLNAGRNDVRIRLIRTWDRTWGGVISVLTFIAVSGLWYVGKGYT
ncbi:MAG TPA: 6-pyruvoyl-tetrahydropterin synthase-related protein [Terriglobales bacterium]